MKTFKNKFKLLTGLLVFAMAVFGIGASNVKADDVPSATEAFVYKTIKMADGTTTPSVDYTYSFSAKEYNGATTDLTKVPSVGSTVVSFSAADTGTSDGTTKTVKKGTEVDLSSITFPNAGVYTYTVSEADNYAGSEILTDSKETYEMSVYVINGENGLEIAGITVLQLTDYKGDATNVKVDGSEWQSAEGKGGEFEYTSNYIITEELEFQKTTIGDYADLSKKFTFTIYVKASDLFTDEMLAADYHYKVAGGTEQTFNFTNGLATITGAIANGEKIEFTDLPSGTTYYAVETGIADYTGKNAVVTQGSDGGVTYTQAGISAGNDFTISKDNTASYDFAVLEGDNSVVVTNEYKSVELTGLFVEKLPYILLMLGGVAAVGIYINNRRRRGNY